MSHEVEGAPRWGVALLDFPEAPYGLLDREHLNGAALLSEVAEEGHHHLFVSRRAGLEGVIEYLNTGRYASGDDRRRRAVAPQHRSGAVVVIHGGRKAFRCHDEHVVRQALRAHVREHVQRDPHARTSRIDVEGGHFHPECSGHVTCVRG